MPKHPIIQMLLYVSLLVFGCSSHAASLDVPQNSHDSAAGAVDAVIQWNRTLLVIVRTPGAQPKTVHSTRNFAIMHAAIYDAVNSIDGKHAPYLVRLPGVSAGASQEAAAAAAAHEALVALYPAFKVQLDGQLQQSLAQIPDGPGKTEAIAIGVAVADQILAARANDGANNPPLPYTFGTAPGDYQSTPPNFPPQPQLTQWPRVTPFALRRANQFRPGPPPALTSDEYSDVFNEIKSLGIVGSTTATPDEALTGRFWSGAIQNYWNEITQTAALAHNLTTAQNARLFALVNLSLADSVIAFYDAKYTYNFWRPVTAIRADDPNINPETIPDPNWLPEVLTTAPDPSYPGAHAVISEAAAEILRSFFRRDHLDFSITSEVLPGIERSFTSFSAASEEATLSRIFAGQHFRSDLTAGHRLGRDVADFVADRFLTPIHRSEDFKTHGYETMPPQQPQMRLGGTLSKRTLFLVLVGAFACALLSLRPGTSFSEIDKDDLEAQEVYRAYVKAWKRKDIGALHNVISDNYMAVNFQGKVSSKENEIVTAKMDPEWLSMTVDEIHTRIFGKTAIASGFISAQGSLA